ncbi:MAG: hypothetical protein M2R45_03872 [Verrucomicrobia subdivision 3 bacterium]|nr:hypothetical protein [Limisphaerales bacterium]MCS1412576.1 hypothetical protein [Limisphaerales bacterium]
MWLVGQAGRGDSNRLNRFESPSFRPEVRPSIGKTLSSEQGGAQFTFENRPPPSQKKNHFSFLTDSARDGLLEKISQQTALQELGNKRTEQAQPFN